MGRLLNTSLRESIMNKYIVFSVIALLFVVGAYCINFYYVLGLSVSDKTDDWAKLGDFLGGVLGPILSFISIVLLVRSLDFQKSSNESLAKEIKNNEKIEKMKSFELLFFNLVSSQKDLFDSFKVKCDLEYKYKAGAVIFIEEEVENMRSNGASDEKINEYIQSIDLEDQMFGLIRAFFVIVNLIVERLSDENGFTCVDRRTHLLTLINYTDFSQIRIVIMMIQFMGYHSSRFLSENEEFKSALDEVGLNLKLY